MGALGSKADDGGEGGGRGDGECNECGDALGERFTRALERDYHPECFVCAGGCGQGLADEEFFVVEDEALCGNCYAATSDKCEGCRRSITEGSVFSTRGRSFHEDCFRCAECGELCLDDFFTDEESGSLTLYCRTCNFGASDDAGGACSWCEEAVEKDGIRALGRTWHDECFRCNDCETHLLGIKEGFFHVDGKLYCRESKCVFARDHKHTGHGRVDKGRLKSLLEVIRSPVSGDRRVRRRIA